MRFNLSAWALHNRQIVVYLMLLLAVVGALSYSKLGQSEDPPFTFKAMVIQTQWPGLPPRKCRARSPSASRRS
ncbi:RND efflux transporter [Pseudomonas sp. BAY1663]|nr:RND efflux transporter [Pseudomonas sp. BAY1663]